MAGQAKVFLDAGKVMRYIGINEGNRFLDLGGGDGYFSIAASQVVGKEGAQTWCRKLGLRL